MPHARFSENYKNGTLLDNNDASTYLQNILIHKFMGSFCDYFNSNHLRSFNTQQGKLNDISFTCRLMKCSIFVDRLLTEFRYTTPLAGSSTSNNDVQCPFLFSVVTAYQVTSSCLLSSQEHVCFAMLVSQFNIQSGGTGHIQFRETLQ